MTEYYWMRTCVLCDGEGRLIIMKDLTRDALYLHCEECEQGWRDPAKTDDVSASFLTLLEDFETASPSREEIERHGWGQYVAGSIS